MKLKKLSRAAAISTGPDTHLDHLSVICDLMDVPLIVTDPQNAIIAKEYYPQIETDYVPFEELTLDYLASHLDVIYECGKFWTLELLPLFELLYQKKMRIVFCPHGNSDKGHTSDLPQLPLGEDISLVYGKQMKDRLKKTSAGRFVETGNLRLNFYQKHKNHFDLLAEKKVFSKFQGEKPIILYAPTWHTDESPTSFFHSVSALIEDLSPDYHLLIKLHPLLEENQPALFYHLLGKYEGQKNLLFLKEFPPIYPLLERSSIYIGDYSSIGYDFLIYDKPLYFLNPAKKDKTLLQNCGIIIEQLGNVKKMIDSTLEMNQIKFREMRKKTYRDAFGIKIHPEKVKENIEKRLYLNK